MFKFNTEKVFGAVDSVVSDEGKVKSICTSVKEELMAALPTAPEFLYESEQPKGVSDIELSPMQKIGNAARDQLFDRRRSALKLAGLDPTSEFNKQIQINEIQKVIRDSVDLVAKGKYATKAEIQLMIARIEAAEAGTVFSDKKVDPSIFEAASKFADVVSGNTTNPGPIDTKRTFTFAEALESAKQEYSKPAEFSI